MLSARPRAGLGFSVLRQLRYQSAFIVAGILFHFAMAVTSISCISAVKRHSSNLPRNVGASTICIHPLAQPPPMYAGGCCGVRRISSTRSAGVKPNRGISNCLIDIPGETGERRRLGIRPTVGVSRCGARRWASERDRRLIAERDFVVSYKQVTGAPNGGGPSCRGRQGRDLSV